MIVRKARIPDVPRINELISAYAELDRMLFRSPADIYENLQMFNVAQEGEQVVGCCALNVIWADLAEVKSLAVDQDYMGRGIGSALVRDHLESARELGLSRVFALTLEPVFFERLGFKRVNRNSLPMKVWSDCARCSKQDQCDEIAMIYDLSETVKG